MRYFQRAAIQDSPTTLTSKWRPGVSPSTKIPAKLDSRHYGSARRTGRDMSTSHARRHSSNPSTQAMMVPMSTTQDLAGLVTNTGMPPSTAIYNQSWTSPSLPLQGNMYQTAPSDWNFPGDSYGTSTNFMSPPQHYQNPYTVDWQPPNTAYGTQPNTMNPYYPSQAIGTPSRQQYPITADHNPYGYGTQMTQSSPATTSTSLSSSSTALRATTLPEPTPELPHVCRVRGCGRAYKRKAELDRHTQEKHGPTSGRLLCPVSMCPRGISGEGFDRMSHLTQHLRSGKHKFSPQQAKFMARQHNPRKGGSGI